jgi:hypothetical protein
LKGKIVLPRSGSSAAIGGGQPYAVFVFEPNKAEKTSNWLDWLGRFYQPARKTAFTCAKTSQAYS